MESAFMYFSIKIIWFYIEAWKKKVKVQAYLSWQMAM